MTHHTLKLPHQKPPLTANMRHHWAQKARTTRQLRHDTRLLARANNLPKGALHATVHITYTPKDNRRRDPSNLMPTQKACLDGLVDYGLVPDDNPTYVEERMPVIAPKNGEPMDSRVRVEIDLAD